jgi:hypothetical protein
MQSGPAEETSAYLLDQTARGAPATADHGPEKGEDGELKQNDEDHGQ